MSIEEIRLANWGEFEEKATALISDIEEKRRTFITRILEGRSDELPTNPDLPLFRGQASSKWKLETTLERATGKDRYSVDSYYHLLHRVKPALESFLNDRWELERNQKYARDRLHFLPNYEFLVYLRQYGFPSPLLDWSRSPYVAAYFAYSTCVNEDVAIYAFSQSYHRSVRVYRAGEMDSCRGGHYVRSTTRHFLQQSDYTFFSEKLDDEWEFINAEYAFSSSSNAQNDLLVKYVLPQELKDEVMKRLDSMNINGYSLLGTTESLLVDLFNREKDCF